MVSHPQGRNSVSKWLNNELGLHRASARAQRCFEARDRAYQKTRRVETHPNPRYFNAQSTPWKFAIREHRGGTLCGAVGCEMFQLSNGRSIRDWWSAGNYPNI